MAQVLCVAWSEASSLLRDAGRGSRECVCAGPNSTVRRAIVDKNARIGANVQIVNKDGVRESNRESEGFVIKDGIVVVIKDSIIPDGTII